MTNESSVGKERSDFVWKGDTWWVAELPCPDCGGRLSSNGRIYDCPDCDWWGESLDTATDKEGDDD